MKVPHTFFKLPRVVVAGVLSVLLASVATAATYYVDPATGSMGNPGTSAQPWSTLEAVFTANKTFAAGDVILLRTGYHGFPSVKGNNSGVVTIQPDSGATPKLKKLIVKSGSQWVISGLDICPENAAPGTYDTGTLVDIQSTANNITLQNCTLRKVLNIDGFTVNDWYARVGGGNAIYVRAPYTTLAGNSLLNVGFGVSIDKAATNSLVSRNTITNFYNDAIRGLADFCTYEYNTVKNSYVSDNNHDDFFQSWSLGTDNISGHGTVYNVTIRGNIFISNTDPAQPLQAPAQGIGCFDGMFENWVVENNVVSSKTYHGIALYGAINCRIANNTVAENPVNGSSSVRPWVAVFEHKKNADNTAWAVPASGNVIRNNISASAAAMPVTSGTKDHNLTTTAYTTHFTNYGALDFSLKATSSAIGAGVTTNTPTADILGRARSVAYDVGAYEYPSAYQQWLQTNGLPLDASGPGAPTANPSSDGVPNALKCALGLALNAERYGGRMTTGRVSDAGGAEYVSLTYTRPEPQLAGVSYTVKTSTDLLTWSDAEVVEVSNVVNGALRTITVRDTKAFTGPDPNRFIRLEVIVP